MIKSLKNHFLFLLFIVFLIGLIFITYRHYGITWDEGSFLISGHQYTKEILDALHIPNNLIADTPGNWIEHLLAHGVFFDVLIAFLSLLTPNFNYETYHLFKALLTIPAFIFLYLAVIKITKDNRLGLAAILLLLLFPRFSGDMFNNSIDVPTATMLAITVYFFFRYLLARQHLTNLFLLGLSMGITINQRVILWYVYILIVGVTTVYLLLEKKSFGYIAKQLSLFILFTLIFLHLTQPYLLSHPIVGIFDTVSPSKSFPFYAANLFNGQFVSSNNLPWYYILQLMVITTPLSTLALFIIGNFYLFFQIINRKQLSKQKTIYMFLLALFYTPFIIILLMRPVLYDNWRHFLFLTVPLIIISVFGLKLILLLKNQALRSVICLLIGFDLIFTFYTIIKLYPYHYMYYNQLVGGLPGAYGKYETDYWGAAFKEATLWFNTHLNNPQKTYWIFTEGWPQSSTEYFKPNMRFTYDYPLADYVFTFTRWNVDQKHPGKIIHTIQRQGVPLVYIKQGQKNIK